jgi:hypothetical protein
MGPEDFIAYVGDPEIHDGRVVSVVRGAADAVVVVRGNDESL